MSLLEAKKGAENRTRCSGLYRFPFKKMVSLSNYIILRKSDFRQFVLNG